MLITYHIHQITDYIHWLYFFHAWGFEPRFATIAELHGCDSCRASWLVHFPEEERSKAAEAMQLFKEAQRLLAQLDEDFSVKVLFELYPAVSEDEDLWIGTHRFPLLRQQTRKATDGSYLCLSDFIIPKEQASTHSEETKWGVSNTVGVFAATVDETMEQLYANDPYKKLLVQTLADRLAEAAVERMHEEVRKTYWGYAKEESLDIREMLQEKFQGIRPAVGYPSLPDQSVNFIIDELLGLKQIGLTLTENGAMHPHASVSGLMFAHPAAHYFAVGNISKEQLQNYAERRGIDETRMRQFLASNISE